MSPAIHLATALPGPKSLALAARRAAAVPKGVSISSGLAVVRAENAVIEDADGNRLIDFAGGIGVMNAGHRHPAVVEAIRAQLDQLTEARSWDQAFDLTRKMTDTFPRPKELARIAKHPFVLQAPSSGTETAPLQSLSGSQGVRI